MKDSGSASQTVRLRYKDHSFNAKQFLLVRESHVSCHWLADADLAYQSLGRSIAHLNVKNDKVYLRTGHEGPQEGRFIALLFL